MSNFNVELNLVNRNGTKRFEVGDAVELSINLSVRKGFSCKGLFIETWWYSHGRGLENQGSIDPHHIIGQEFAPGEYQFKKSFIIQPGPATFHGYYINIDWCVEVRIHGPKVLLGKKRLGFAVLSKPYTQPIPPERRLFTGVVSGKAKPSFFRELVRFFTGLSLLFIIYLAMSYGFTKLALLPGLIFSIFIVYVWKRKLKKRPFNNLIFDVNTPCAHSGQPIDVGISFDAGPSVRIQQVLISLIGYESIGRENTNIFSNGPSIIFEERESFRHEFELSGPIDTIKNQLNQTRKTITIPPDLPSSFEFRYNQFRWKLDMRMLVEGEDNIHIIRPLKIV